MFTWFDIIILTVITASSIFGIYGGIIKLIIGLLGFIFSITLTVFLYPYTHEIMAHYLSQAIPCAIISGIISYLISLIVCSLLTHKLLLIASSIRGGIIDRLFGLIAGFARGVIICLLLFVSVAVLFSGSYLEAKTFKDVIDNTTIDKYPKWLQASITTHYLDQVSRNCISAVPYNDLELTKLPNQLNKNNVNDVLEKAQLKKIITTIPSSTIADQDTTILEELDHDLKEIITIEQITLEQNNQK